MKTSDFDFDLPDSFIAQDPAVPRDSSKLMQVHSSSRGFEDRVFRDLLDILTEDDVLVLNQSKVIPARVSFSLDDRDVEIFVLSELEDNVFECLVRPGKLFKPGYSGEIGGVGFEVIYSTESGSRMIRFGEAFDLHDFGSTPLPPYIDKSSASDSQYQTVYAADPGSVAAPTAGLHFTESLLDGLRTKGVKIETVTLHVGRGTFLPVKTEDFTEHKMHSEFFVIDDGTAKRLSAYKAQGKRIIAVGTTSIRVLESSYDEELSRFVAQSSSTEIFIYPGYQWKAVDALITNFHLPKSTLIMLVASMLENCGSSDGAKDVLHFYEQAKKHRYRFYSFGDAMFIS